MQPREPEKLLECRHFFSPWQVVVLPVMITGNVNYTACARIAAACVCIKCGVLQTRHEGEQ